MSDKLTAYVSELTEELNQGTFKPDYPYVGYGNFVAMSFGLAEEVHEAYFAWETYPESLEFELECGDVIAYAVLLLRVYYNDPKLIVHKLFDNIGENYRYNSTQSLLLTLNGLLKRHFRGDDGYCLFVDDKVKQEFIDTVVNLARNVYKLTPTVDLETILNLNLTKLRKRYSNK